MSTGIGGLTTLEELWLDCNELNEIVGMHLWTCVVYVCVYT